MQFKFLAALVCGVLMLTSSLCMAAVDGGKISIGSIYPGMSVQELIKTCGQPLSKDRNGDDWQYQNFEIEVEGNVVEEISTRSSTIATPDGVRVGQAAEVLNSTFGTADKFKTDSDGVEYKYFSTDGMKEIEFKVVNGVIAKITCSLRD